MLTNAVLKQSRKINVLKAFNDEFNKINSSLFVFLIFVVLWGISSFAFAAGTSFESIGKDAKKEKTDITATEMQYFLKNNELIFKGNVRVHQKSSDMFAAKMILDLEEVNGKTDFTKIKAYKNVQLFSKGIKAKGDSGSYNIKTGDIIISKNVVVVEDGITIYGEEFQYNVQTGKSNIIGNKATEKRVIIILDDVDELEKRVEKKK